MHPAFEDHPRGERVEPGLALALADRHVGQALARFATRQPLVEHLDGDSEPFRQLLRKFPRPPSSRTFTAIHVERQADDDRADATLTQHRSYSINVMLDCTPLDDANRMPPH